jgi:hypothetical protein
MRLRRLIAWLRQHLRLVLRGCYLLLALLVLLDAIPAIVDKDHAHTWGERHLPGFWAVFGFVGCVVLILASKAFGHLGIMTREDYYDE